MEKGPVVPAEPCTDMDIANMHGQPVIRSMPSLKLHRHNIVSAIPSFAEMIGKVALSSIDRYESQGYPLPKPAAALFGQKDFKKCPPIVLSVDGKEMPAYSNNFQFAAINGEINRSVFACFAADLPNEAAKGRPTMLFESGEDSSIPQFLASIFKGNQYFRTCPGGRTSGSGTSGGVSSGGGATSSSLLQQWVTGTGGGGAYYGSSAGGGDDDDPWKHQRPISLTPSHYIDNQFQENDDFDKLVDDLLRDCDGGLFPEILLPDLNPLTHPVHTRPDDVSDPAPMTPLTPAPPGTPASYYGAPMGMDMGRSMEPMLTGAYANMGGASGMNGPGAPESTMDVGGLLQIHKLMAAPPAPPTANGSVHAPMVIPQQPTGEHLTGQQVFQLTHPTPSPAPPSPAPQPVNTCSYAMSQSVTEFFGVNVSQNERRDERVFKYFVKDRHDRQSFNALEFCWSLYRKYENQLEKQCTLPIANQGMAKLCSQRLDQDCNLLLSLPLNCVPLSEWVAVNTDLRSHVLVLQQVVNTLVVIFQGEENLSFWGSYEVYVAPNSQAYIYINFNRSLTVQKVYATTLTLKQANSRIEDCLILKNIFDVLIKKFIDGRWVSPQLADVLQAFSDLVNSTRTCVNEVTTLARILGQRRVCKMQARVYGQNGEYTVYSVEHEPVSSSLSILKPLVAQFGPCYVLHSDQTFVNIAEVSARGSKNHQFILFPCGQDTSRRLGILYIE